MRRDGSELRLLVLAALVLASAACSEEAPAPSNAATLPPGPIGNTSEIDPAALPAGLKAVVDATVPGMTVAEAEREEREGRVYYDVEGRRPGGEAVELDVLEQDGKFQLVEVQRDIAWKDAPAPVQAAASEAQPVRVIESRQNDGSIVYELFEPNRPGEPAIEIGFKDGKAERLTERSRH